MTEDLQLHPSIIHKKIHTIRNQKVMLDFDLAELYKVETKNLNLSVKRNIKRFPPDFMFQLNPEEWDSLRLQIETSKRGGRRYLPYAFTDYNDINDDTRLQIELINQSFADLHTDRKRINKS